MSYADFLASILSGSIFSPKTYEKELQTVQRPQLMLCDTFEYSLRLAYYSSQTVKYQQQSTQIHKQWLKHQLANQRVSDVVG